MTTSPAPGNSGKIFGIGLSKTGTTSLCAALQELGYRAGTFRHFKELLFEEWFRGDFSRDYLQDFDALTDLPMASFLPQLDQKYPGSKFILTVRDIDSWLTSVARQFTRKPEPEAGFRRDVRMAAYGTSVFNEARFRFVYRTHLRNVEWYFQERPRDLLVMDICDGDGWEKLCSFLDQPQPATSFPLKRPGHKQSNKPRPAPTTETSNTANGDPSKQPFAFVIPLRNPGDSKVQDYETILAFLRQTIQSLLRQTHQNIHVVVVCHGAPPWSNELDERVTFLDVSGCSTFQPDGLYKNTDKGLRWITGTMYARVRIDPKLVMLLDADDYVHVQLAAHLLNRLNDQSDDDSDGFIIDNGVHSQVRVESDHSIRYQNAFVVKEFSRSCGSCRIFKTAHLLDRLREIDPDFESHFQDWEAPDQRRSVSVPSGYVEWLFQATEGFQQSEQGVLGVIGRHGKQHTYFQLDNVEMYGAAKSCGHGNHQGSRQGAIHWERIVQPLSMRRFHRDFGIEQDGSAMHYFSRLRGRLMMVREKFRKKI